jgi:hypothetical protein
MSNSSWLSFPLTHWLKLSEACRSGEKPISSIQMEANRKNKFMDLLSVGTKNHACDPVPPHLKESLQSVTFARSSRCTLEQSQIARISSTVP